jgi:SAM-dependent methyltransferase
MSDELVENNHSKMVTHVDGVMEPATLCEMRTFGRSLASIGAIWAKYREQPISEVMSPLDDMAHPEWDKHAIHYRSVGTNAIELILNAMLATRKTTVGSILDMPCGFGRVTRHLSAAFPDARLYASDLYINRIQFCAKEFKAVPIASNQDFRKVEFPEKFDLIWCGSLLTHLPEREFRDALLLFANSLADNGVAIITTLGRASPFVQREVFPYLSQDIYDASKIEEDFARNGFGYADYNEGAKFFKQEKYGIAFISPSFVLKCLENNPRVTVRGLSERGWDDQQDVVVIHKVPLNSRLDPDLLRA